MVLLLSSGPLQYPLPHPDGGYNDVLITIHGPETSCQSCADHPNSEAIHVHLRQGNRDILCSRGRFKPYQSDDNACLQIVRGENTIEGVVLYRGNATQKHTQAMSLAQTDQPKRLPCGHILHWGCLQIWFEREVICPLCRRPVWKKRRE